MLLARLSCLSVQELRIHLLAFIAYYNRTSNGPTGRIKDLLHLRRLLCYFCEAVLERHIDARFDAQTTAIRTQFEETNIAVTALATTVGRQGQDIRAMRENLHNATDHLDGVDVRLDRMDSRFEGIEKRFDVQDGKLNQILELLPRQSDSCSSHVL